MALIFPDNQENHVTYTHWQRLSSLDCLQVSHRLDPVLHVHRPLDRVRRYVNVVLHSVVHMYSCSLVPFRYTSTVQDNKLLIRDGSMSNFQNSYNIDAIIS